MRRGCISLGDVQCDECHQVIPYAERYLVIDAGEGKLKRVCFKCCENEGYIGYKEDKGQPVLTFFQKEYEA